ncbi:MAG: hypothetical protein MZV64_27680 [Ignavibacteriales bacterium]|nr:hypothetical protein [Ignavibacteriales bacterium]
MLKIMNREELEPVILNQAQNEIKHQYLSANKAKNLLKWQPKYTLEQGLTETIEWYKEFFNVQYAGKDYLRGYDKTAQANY